MEAGIDLWVQLLLFALSIIVMIVGWFTKDIHTEVKRLRLCISELKAVEAGEAVRLENAADKIKRNDEWLNRIETKIDDMRDELHRKADKTTCMAYHPVRFGPGPSAGK